MIDINQIKDILNTSEDFSSSLDLLIDFSIDNQTLTFPNSIADIDILHQYEIIKKISDKYQFNNNGFFAFKLYNRYKEKLDISVNNDFRSFLKITEEIEKLYKSETVVRGLSSLINDLWAITIFDANDTKKIDFSEYIDTLSIEKNRQEIFSFNEGYSLSLAFLNIKVQTFYENAKKLIYWINSDAEYNFPLGGLLKGIKNKVHNNSDFGLECFEYIKRLKEYETDILIPIITGLYDNLGANFFNNYVKESITDRKYSIAIICGLSNIEIVATTEAKLLLKVYDTTQSSLKENIVYIPRLLFAIIKSKNLKSESKNIKKSFKLLESLISIDNPNLIYYILRELKFLENYYKDCNRIILKLIEQPHFKEEILVHINQIIYNRKDLELFERVLNSLATYYAFKSISKFFNSSIYEFINTNKKELDRIIVLLSIDNKASKRFLAADLFGFISKSSYTFNFNILELDSLSQYKLWVSVLQTYREPKYSIPCLLPLLKSDSEFIKESFICKLEEYSENYGGGVTDVLKNSLDLEDGEMNKIYMRIESYLKSYYDTYVMVKKELKELNPDFTHNELFSSFNRDYFRKFNKQLQKSTDESSSIMNLFSKVTLLKGGGWKTEGRKEISKLGKISSSFSLPRRYFIEPEHFDFENSRELAKDWDENRFQEIQRILENEQ